MSATMARHRGHVQLEQSDIRRALNMAKIAQRECSHTTIEHTQFLIKNHCTEVLEEKNRGVEFLAHNKLKAAIE
jgi:hypothetical protein